MFHSLNFFTLNKKQKPTATKKMEKSKQHLRHCLLYEFTLGHSEAEAYKNVKSVFGDECFSEAICRAYFDLFREGNISLEDEPFALRSSFKVYDDVLCSLVEKEPHLTTRELAARVDCDHSTIIRQLTKLGYSGKMKINHREESPTKKAT